MLYLCFLADSSAFAAFAQTHPLTPEQHGDLYMARKMYREAIDTYRAGDETPPSCGTRSASPTTSWAI